MRNFIFISPHFPDHFVNFVKALKNNGFNVLGIGDCPYDSLCEELKSNLTEYYACYDMENFEKEVNAVRYFVEKYGEIEYVESLNEYWLKKEAKIREIFDIKKGVRPSELQYWQKKSLMKERYTLAGAKTAKFIVSSKREDILSFISEVGFPVFIKPNIGVGAEGDFKISTIEDLDNFIEKKSDCIEYICEQFLTGNIISFDGIADSNSNVVFCASNYFPPSIASIVKDKKDLFYYSLPEVPQKLKEIGEKIIKVFNVKQRYFHLEFFELTKDIPGFAKAGEMIPLETNMRPAGGYTPDMINFANSISTYQIYADVMAYDSNSQISNGNKYYCACASRRDAFNYLHSDEEIFRNYNICKHGRYADVLSGAMGNRYYMCKFLTFDEMCAFEKFVEERYE